MSPRRFLLLILVPAFLLVVGSSGFMLLEGKSFLDSLYLTVITLTTVGFGDVVPVTNLGKVFTMFLALGGIFTLFYAATEIIRAVIGGEVQAVFGRQFMERNLAGLKNHMIVCGYGRMGRLVCKEFSTQHLPFVIIDKEADLVAAFKMPHGLALLGDATADETLKQAGVERARALVTVMTSDADNLYTTMSARLLSENLFIVARAEDERAEGKLLRAGANRVVSPYVIGGNRVAQAVLRPTVVDFIELATRTEHLELQIEETQIGSRSTLVGQTLRDSRLPQEFGIIIVAMKKASGQMVFNPPSEAVMESGDILITLGHREQLDQLETRARG